MNAGSAGEMTSHNPGLGFRVYSGWTSAYSNNGESNGKEIQRS